ncbi:MAG: choice-of-anchor Q domain-containing protein [Bacteroides sp.]|nr:choice-of-anchor Q domain-containing protein [Bacteroides sp.]
MRIYILAFCSLFLATQASSGQTITVEGEVMGLWNYDTVKVTGDIHIAEGSTLMIGSGVVVQFQGYFNLLVLGDIQVLGVPDNPVLFTVSDTTGLYELNTPAGGWNGISLMATPEKNWVNAYFEYAHFEYAKAWQGDTLHHGGAIYMSGPVEATFLNCSFAQNRTYLSGAGMYFNSTSPRVERCIFSENQAGHTPPLEEQYGYGGGLCGLNTKAVIRGNVFTGNASTGIGGGMSIDEGDPIIEHNIFEANGSPLGGGLGILRSQVSGTISNNLVLHNTAMFFGGGMALINTRANISNNTIVGNYGGYGGGLYFNAEAFVKVYNTILWGNWANSTTGGSVFIWDSNSIPNFYNCTIDGGQELFDGAAFQGEFIGNISTDPVFSGEGQWPWQLEPQSPAINAGSEDPGFLMLPEFDLSGTPRIQLGRIDMGAFEADSILHTAVPIIETKVLDIQVFPNPALDHTSIRLHNAIPGPVQVLVFDTRGQLAGRVYDGLLEPGSYEFKLDLPASGLRKGVYYIVAKSKEGKASARLLVFSR